MKYKRLGKSDLKVSSICLGTMTMGTQNNKEQSHDIMDFAYNKGINFIDTAEQYLSPSSENLYGITKKIVGEWISKKIISLKSFQCKNRYNLIYRNYNPELINFCKIN